MEHQHNIGHVVSYYQNYIQLSGVNSSTISDLQTVGHDA